MARASIDENIFYKCAAIVKRHLIGTIDNPLIVLHAKRVVERHAVKELSKPSNSQGEINRFRFQNMRALQGRARHNHSVSHRLKRRPDLAQEQPKRAISARKRIVKDEDVHKASSSA